MEKHDALDAKVRRARHGGVVRESPEGRAFAPRHAGLDRTAATARLAQAMPAIDVASAERPGRAAAPVPVGVAGAGSPQVDGPAGAAVTETGAPAKDAAAKARSPRTAWDFASAGTYVDRSLPVGWSWAAVVLALAVILVPSIGMAWAFTDSTSENRELAAAPSLFGEDGAPNAGVLQDAGTWFEDHFAYRNQLVAANARLRAALGTSSTDQVVVGSDGWLYYGGTLPDYLGQSALSERALANIAHNLVLAQGYVSGHGGRFLFTVAPNKNSLYDENMPSYYLRFPGKSNFERLKPYLDAAGVNYVDLQGYFEGLDGTWYLKTDSHWDNRGALLATNQMLSGLGIQPLDVDAESGEGRVDFLGDLESMLLPAGASREGNWYFAGYNDGPDATGSLWRYAEGSEQDVTADWIQTQAVAGDAAGDNADSASPGASATGPKGLLMFRDSFGNALEPYWAATFPQAAFSKLIPYNLPQMTQVGADTVVIERAERHLPYLAENPPIMASPQVKSLGAPVEDGVRDLASASAAMDGPYVVVSGAVDGRALSNDLRIYVGVVGPDGRESLYDAFWTSQIRDDGTSADGGFQVRLAAQAMNAAEGSALEVRVYGVAGEKATCLGEFPALAIE